MLVPRELGGTGGGVGRRGGGAAESTHAAPSSHGPRALYGAGQRLCWQQRHAGVGGERRLCWAHARGRAVGSGKLVEHLFAHVKQQRRAQVREEGGATVTRGPLHVIIQCAWVSPEAAWLLSSTINRAALTDAPPQ